MDITKTILYLHPTLEFWKDFIVYDNMLWEWPKITWYNQIIPQPTQAELDACWITCESEMIIKAKLQRMQDIKIEIKNLWGVDVPTYTALDTANASRIAELTTEFDLIKAEVSTYEPTMINDVLVSFFG